VIEYGPVRTFTPHLGDTYRTGPHEPVEACDGPRFIERRCAPQHRPHEAVCRPI
jgi:hypothetical protein